MAGNSVAWAFSGLGVPRRPEPSDASCKAQVTSLGSAKAAGLTVLQRSGLRRQAGCGATAATVVVHLRPQAVHHGLVVLVPGWSEGGGNSARALSSRAQKATLGTWLPE